VSLRGATNGRDAAIHRGSKDAFGGCGSAPASQWIAAGFALAMTRVVVSPSPLTLHPSIFTLRPSLSRKVRFASSKTLVYFEEKLI